MKHGDSRRRVAIIGAGMVGATFAYAMTMKGVARELALVDVSRERAMGEAMDLRHGSALLEPLSIEAGGYELCEGAQLVVITAGAPQKEGQTRLDLAQQNADIMRAIIPQILAHNPDPILLVASNPMDVLTKVALKESGLSAQQVFGSGTVLDSSRFRSLLASHCNLDPRNVHAHVLGEHGDSEVLVWSQVNLAGVPMEDYCLSCSKQCDDGGLRQRLSKKVPQAAYEVIKRKGATYYAIGLALTRIAEAVLKDQHSLLTVSALANNLPGLEDVCLSLPCVVGGGGVERIVTPHLAEDEDGAMKASAKILRHTLLRVNALD
jgi:L-lactate dehydrogenase